MEHEKLSACCKAEYLFLLDKSINVKVVYRDVEKKCIDLLFDLLVIT